MKLPKFNFYLVLAAILLVLFPAQNNSAISRAQDSELQYELMLTIDNGRPAREIKWSPDGRQLAGEEPNQPFPFIKIWNADTGELEHRLEPPGLFTDTTDIYLAWHPHENLLASTYEAYDMDFVHIWDTNTGELMSIIEGTGRGNDIDWSPDGTKLVIVHGAVEDKTASVWSIDGGLIAQLDPAPVDLYSIDWSPDGNYIVTADFVGEVDLGGLNQMWQVWSTETYEEVYRLQPEGSYLGDSVTWNNDGTCAWGLSCTTDNDCQIMSWNIELDSVHRYSGPQLGYRGSGKIVFSPTQPLIAYTPGTYIFNTNGIYLGQIPVETYVTAVDWSPSADLLAAAYGDGKIRVWEVTYHTDETEYKTNSCNTIDINP